jgi:hypothetical protein
MGLHRFPSTSALKHWRNSAPVLLDDASHPSLEPSLSLDFACFAAAAGAVFPLSAGPGAQ